MKELYKDYRELYEMKIECGCHCIKCGKTDLGSNRVGEIEKGGYFDMHHTCKNCNTHFDHLEGEIFESCNKCKFNPS